MKLQFANNQYLMSKRFSRYSKLGKIINLVFWFKVFSKFSIFDSNCSIWILTPPELIILSNLLKRPSYHDYISQIFFLNTFIYHFTTNAAATAEFRAQIQVKNVWNNNTPTFLCTALLFDTDATKSVPRWWSKTPRPSRNRWLVAILTPLSPLLSIEHEWI